MELKDTHYGEEVHMAIASKTTGPLRNNGSEVQKGIFSANQTHTLLTNNNAYVNQLLQNHISSNQSKKYSQHLLQRQMWIKAVTAGT